MILLVLDIEIYRKYIANTWHLTYNLFVIIKIEIYIDASLFAKRFLKIYIKNSK